MCIESARHLVLHMYTWKFSSENIFEASYFSLKEDLIIRTCKNCDIYENSRIYCPQKFPAIGYYVFTTKCVNQDTLQQCFDTH